jgi:hypothetical protein
MGFAHIGHEMAVREKITIKTGWFAHFLFCKKSMALDRDRCRNLLDSQLCDMLAPLPTTTTAARYDHRYVSTRVSTLTKRENMMKIKR